MWFYQLIRFDVQPLKSKSFLPQFSSWTHRCGRERRGIYDDGENRRILAVEEQSRKENHGGALAQFGEWIVGILKPGSYHRWLQLAVCLGADERTRDIRSIPTIRVLPRHHFCLLLNSGNLRSRRKRNKKTNVSHFKGVWGYQVNQLFAHALFRSSFIPQAKRNFDQLVNLHLKSIEECRIAKNKRCGILPFVSSFEEFVSEAETIFKGTKSLPKHALPNVWGDIGYYLPWYFPFSVCLSRDYPRLSRPKPRNWS